MKKIILSALVSLLSTSAMSSNLLKRELMKFTGDFTLIESVSGDCVERISVDYNSVHVGFDITAASGVSLRLSNIDNGLRIFIRGDLKRQFEAEYDMELKKVTETLRWWYSNSNAAAKKEITSSIQRIKHGVELFVNPKFEIDLTKRIPGGVCRYERDAIEL